jgi:hypothetical protein
MKEDTGNNNAIEGFPWELPSMAGVAIVLDSRAAERIFPASQ